MDSYFVPNGVMHRMSGIIQIKAVLMRNVAQIAAMRDEYEIHEEVDGCFVSQLSNALRTNILYYIFISYSFSVLPSIYACEVVPLAHTISSALIYAFNLNWTYRKRLRSFFILSLSYSNYTNIRVIGHHLCQFALYIVYICVYAQ